MLQPGEIVSYTTMCQHEGVNLQRGMNFCLKGGLSVILMSLRRNAPYADRVEDEGRILIYEGHDIPRYEGLKQDPKTMDQPERTPNGTLTENGKFHKVAQDFKNGRCRADLIKVYEKIRDGIWTYSGIFKLVDSWKEHDGKRNVFKFKLCVTDKTEETRTETKELDHTRMIPTNVKLEVWKRDKGQCVMCGVKDNLHFDHIIPYSKGGTSLKADNIQLLCVRHNLEKRDDIV